jgi:hypothetical protein
MNLWCTPLVDFVYMCLNVFVFICILCNCKLMCMQLCVCVCMQHTQIHTQTGVHDKSASMRCIDTFLHAIHACMHTYMHTYIHTYTHKQVFMKKAQTCVLMSPKSHACMHTYIHTCLHTYAGVHEKSANMRFDVTKITRIQNMSLWRPYHWRKQQVTEGLPEMRLVSVYVHEYMYVCAL